MLRDKYELNLIYDDFAKRIKDLQECLNLDLLKKNISDLEAKSNADDFWNDNKEASKILKRLGTFKNELSHINKLQGLLSDYRDLLDMPQDEEVGDLIDSVVEETTNLLEKMELEILLSGPFDDNNAIVEIHPGAGGVEAHDWADMLYRMYLRYCDKNNFKVEIVDHLDGVYQRPRFPDGGYHLPVRRPETGVRNG